MIRRIFVVGFYTGTAHLVSILAISYLLRNLGERTLGFIGLVDSTVLIVAGIVSFGIQLSVNRNVALQKNWRSNYHLGQSARFTASLLVVSFGIFSYLFNWDPTKMVYFIAPLIAFNGDYALYGSGKPIHAARLSFFRVLMPYSGLIIVTRYFETDYLSIYVTLIGLGILNSGFFAARINHVSYLFPVDKEFYKFYLKYYKVGLFQISSVLLITGILAVSKGFYTIEVIGLVYGLLKIFEVFKGGLRIIVQAFFKELQHEIVGLKIDKLGILIGAFILIPTILYTETTLNLLFADAYDNKSGMLVLFGIAMFIASFKTSADIRVLLQKRDNVNLRSYLIALFATIIIVIIMSRSQYNLYGIPSGLIVGELILLLTLGWNLGRIGFFAQRMIFLLKVSPMLIVSYGIKILFEASIFTLAISSALYAIFVVYVFRKLIFGSAFKNN